MPRRLRSVSLTLLSVASWPLLFASLYFTGSTPEQGQRWADAHPGRGTVLAITLLIWSVGLLLGVIWLLAFRLVVPGIERSRAARASAAKQ